MPPLNCQSFNIVKDGTRIPKWLYHVTRPKYLPSILREGLRPRKGRKAKRPEYASCPLLVYFKREIGSCRDGHPGKPCDCVLLVVNQDALVRELFRPDEDRLFDRGNYSCICGAVRPGQYYDDFIEWKNHAEDCLITNIEARANAFTDDDITVAYKGTVPPDAIVATGPLVTSHEWAVTAETIKANKPLVHRSVGHCALLGKKHVDSGAPAFVAKTHDGVRVLLADNQ